MTMNCVQNDQGGITYATTQRIGQPERRHETLNEVRMLVDAMTELGQAVREQWPEGTTMPSELQSRILFNEFILARVRASALRGFAEVIEA